MTAFHARFRKEPGFFIRQSLLAVLGGEDALYRPELSDAVEDVQRQIVRPAGVIFVEGFSEDGVILSADIK